MITYVRSKYLIAFDAEAYTHVLMPGGEIVYEDDHIVFVGRDYDGPYDRRIDALDSLVAPGFVDLDALGDIDHTLVFHEHPNDRGSELSWSQRYFESERKEEMSAEEEAFKSLYAYVQLIRAGVTTAMPITSVIYKKAAETYEEIAAAADHAGHLGLRVYLGPSYLSRKHVLAESGTHSVCLSLPEEEAEEGLQNAERFIQNYHNAYDGLIQAAVVPERLELQTEDSILRSKALARKYNLSFRMHAAQGGMDYGYCMRSFGKSSIAYLDSLGVLDEKTLIPHCIYSSGTHNVVDPSNDDQKILARTGTTVIHCPLVYARGGQYLDSFARFLRLGVRMSMGSDTYPPDPFINIRTGQLMAEIAEPGSPENHSRHFYHAYTVGGADALQRPDLGRLMVGAKADLIFIDVDAPEIGVIDDPLRTITLACTSAQIKHSVINGRTVMWNREIPGIDMQALRDQGEAWYAKMKRSYWTRSSVRDGVAEAELWTSSLDLV